MQRDHPARLNAHTPLSDGLARFLSRRVVRSGVINNNTVHVIRQTRARRKRISGDLMFFFSRPY